MKKRIVGVSLLLILISVSVLGVLTCAFFAIVEANRMFSRPRKLANYLYEITYKDYVVDTELKTIETARPFGCSSVRNGNYYGRNFDYIFNDTPEFVVRVEAKENRHASIGIATHFGLIESKMSSYKDELALIPNLTLDGINDAGVICSHNVVKIEEDNLGPIHTNEGKELLHMMFIPRFVLDNASSVDEAVSLLGQRDIYGDLEGKEYLHIMIADSEKTCIVEFYQGEMIVKYDDNINDATDSIMTNFYLNLPEINEHAQGVERYDILKENYDEGTSVVGMQTLMQRVAYSKAYGLATTNPWYSETLDQTTLKDEARIKERYDEISEALFTSYWDARVKDKRADANPAFWITVHNSTYDMENKKLSLFIQEDYEKHYDFSL